MAVLSQLPDPVDLAFVAGDTFRIRVRVVDPTTSNPQPLTDYDFAAEIAREPDRAIVAQFLVEEDADSIPEGEIYPTAVILTLSSGETAALPGMGNGQQFQGIWDLEVTFPPQSGGTSGDVRTVARGTVNCVLDVSSLTQKDVAVVGIAGAAGEAGTWSPRDLVPTSVAALQTGGITASPKTGWTSGQYVQTKTTGAAGEAHWNGTQWVAGRKP